MGKRTFTVLGTIAAAFMLATTPASAADSILEKEKGWLMFTRSCGSVYSLDLSTVKATGIKYNTGCQGHVWVRVHGNGWGDWHHDKHQVTLNSPHGKFDKALVKSCADCDAHTVYPKNT
ncbi:hypothetical protein [Streptomyces lanatus]|uniref:Uncharacterized protein n=1 Tax=Streptomyces lanatus TaxID=66900 RepID=A0ABV1XUW7_9ACTN|nr:hypothetical protein [Streptomyces lanatus]GHH13228.1 hypothetical protein GCM10018780_52710 [Streptomyces lanatus]